MRPLFGFCRIRSSFWSRCIMSTRKRSAKRMSFLARLSAGFVRLFPLFAFVALLCNLFVVWSFEKSRRPEVHYYIATNAVSAVGSPASSSPSSALLSSAGSFSAAATNVASGVRQVVLSTKYHYFIFDGMRCVKMFDRFYGEGSLTSYGRIAVIFPDCIKLEDGAYILNTAWLGQAVENDKKGGET